MNAVEELKVAQSEINVRARRILEDFDNGYFQTDNSELQHMLQDLKASFDKQDTAYKALTCWAMPRRTA